MEEKTESVNATTTPSQSASGMMSNRERPAAPSVANKACGRLEKLPYPRILYMRCETTLTSSKLFQHSTYALPFHTSLHMRYARTDSHVQCLLTNPHVLVQRLLRCAREAYTANTYTQFTQKEQIELIDIAVSN